MTALRIIAAFIAFYIAFTVTGYIFIGIMSLIDDQQATERLLRRGDKQITQLSEVRGTYLE